MEIPESLAASSVPAEVAFLPAPADPESADLLVNLEIQSPRVESPAVDVEFLPGMCIGYSVQGEGDGPQRNGQCFDLYHSQPLTLQARRSDVLDTGIVLHMDPRANYFCLLSSPHVGGTVIDSDYRGNVRVLLRNLRNDRDIHFFPDQTLVQIVFPLAEKPKLVYKKSDRVIPYNHPYVICYNKWSPRRTNAKFVKNPKRIFEDSVGYDLFLPSPMIINPGQVVEKEMGVRFRIPKGADFHAFVFEKSSMAKTRCVVASTVLSDQFVKLVFLNQSLYPYYFQTSEPVAQVVFLKKLMSPFSIEDMTHHVRYSGHVFYLSTPRPLVIGSGDVEEIEFEFSVRAEQPFVFYLFDEPETAKKNCLVVDKILDPARDQKFRVCLQNVGDFKVHFEEGDPIGNFILMPIADIDLMRESMRLELTERGFGGAIHDLVVETGDEETHGDAGGDTIREAVAESGGEEVTYTIDATGEAVGESGGGATYTYDTGGVDGENKKIMWCDL